MYKTKADIPCTFRWIVFCLQSSFHNTASVLKEKSNHINEKASAVETKACCCFLIYTSMKNWVSCDNLYATCWEQFHPSAQTRGSTVVLNGNHYNKACWWEWVSIQVIRLLLRLRKKDIGCLFFFQGERMENNSWIHLGNKRERSSVTCLFKKDMPGHSEWHKHH